ncbi:MAG: hypothetical protein QM485_01690 [Flavobacteriaceae bacterium]
MRKNNFLLLLTAVVICIAKATSQVPIAEELVGIHTVTTSQITGPITGTFLFNSDINSIYGYNGSDWESVKPQGDETKIIATDNVSITGSGTTADPYIVRSIKPTLIKNNDGTYTFSNGVDPDVIIASSGGGNVPLVTQSNANGSCNNEFQTNKTRDVIIQGDYFDGGSVVTIPGQIINSITINSTTQITTNITAGNSTVDFDIQVTTNVGTGTLSNGFGIKGTLTTHAYSNGEITITRQMSYSSGTLQRTAESGWNTQGYSTLYGIPASKEGYLNFTSGPNNRYRMIGLDNNPAPGISYSTIDYAFYLAANSQVYIYENGSGKGSKSTYVSGDKFEINIDCDGKVTYLKNRAVLYTSTTKATNTLYFDSCFYNSPNNGISNISITY